jgi:uncharacterized repeat protein (TIGR03803 family)
MKRIVNALAKLTNWRSGRTLFLLLCATTAAALPAQTFTTLHSFNNTDGEYPSATLVQGTDGNLYGTTNQGGTNSQGTIFRITPRGTLTTIYSFCPQPGCADGGLAQGALIQASNGDFYGTTAGPNFLGTVFKVTPSGTLTTLHSFCSQGGCTDGELPLDGVVQAIDGNLYGTTTGGGANGYGGTVFKITPSGTLTTLYSFCSLSACADGASPEGGLVQASNGNFYGTTSQFGANGDYGTIFKITPSGTLTTLHSFCAQSGCTDGSNPWAGLAQAANGDLYGTTSGGGAHGNSGTIFKITPSGTLNTLYSFCSQGCADGQSPNYGALVQATDGDFYGETSMGGVTGKGTVFKITPSGMLTTLYSFCLQVGCPDGSDPAQGLVQDTNGYFYGTTGGGGANNFGTVFSLSVGLGPFVKTQPASGKVGAAVKILGTNLTGATSVTFNGTAAPFAVVRPSLITTTVPAGASSGKVRVVTPSGTLSSSVPFRVRP